MGLYKLAEMLSFYDLLEFLKDKNIYEIDIDNLTVTQEIRLLQLIVMLTYEKKLNPVFFYNGLMDMGKYRETEFGLISNEPCKTVHFHGYLAVGHLFNSNLHIQDKWELKGFFEPYKIISTKLENDFNTNGFTHFIKEPNLKFNFIEPLVSREYINFKDIVYPMADIEKILINKEELKLSYAEKSELIKAELSQQVQQLQATIDRLTAENQQQAETIRQLNERLASQPEPTAEPMGDNPSYTTTAITALNHVIKEFWQDWQQGTTAPKQDYIKAWITENYPSLNPTMAERIDRIARHESLKNSN